MFKSITSNTNFQMLRDAAVSKLEHDHHLKQQLNQLNALTEDELKTLVTELSIRQIELELQNEELQKTYQQLELTKVKYHDLYDFAPVGYFTLSNSGYILECNLALSELVELPRENLINKRFLTFIQQKDHSKFIKHRKQVLETEKKYSCELSLFSFTGQPIYVLLESIFVKGQWQCSLIDISQQKNNEQKLILAQRFAHIGAFETYIEQNQEYWSDELFELFGLKVSTASVNILNVLEYIHPIEQESIKTELNQFLNSQKEHYEAQFRIIRADSETRYMHLIAKAFFGLSGQPFKIFATLQDITEFHTTTQKLSRAQISLDRSIDSIFWIDSNGYLLDANESAWKKLNFPNKDSLMQKHIHHIDPQIAKEGWEHYWYNLQKTPYLQELSLHQSYQNEVYPVEVSLHYIQAESDQKAYCFLLARDISRRLKTQQALRHEQNFRQAILDNILAIVIVFDLSGVINYVNPIFEQLTNYTKNELIGVNFFELLVKSQVYSDIKEKLAEYRDHYQQQKYNSPITFECITRRGTTLLLSCRNQILHNETENKDYIILTATDMTDYQAAQLALKHKEQQLQLLTDSIPACISYVDRYYRYQFVNKTYEEWFGLQRDDIVGKSLRKIIGETAYHNIVHYVEQVLQGETVYYETQMSYKYGITRDIMASLIPNKTEQGEVLGYYGMIFDITERKNIEKSLQESEKKYRTLFQLAPIGISVTDDQGRIIEANKMSESILGLSIEQHTQRRYDDTQWQLLNANNQPISSDEFPSVRAMRQQMTIANVELQIITSKQERRWLNISATPIPLDNYGVAIVYSDITWGKKIEAALRRSEERFNLAVRGARDGVWDWHLASNKIFCSIIYKQMLGYQEYELDDHIETILALIHPEDKTLFEATVQHYLCKTVENFEVQIRMQHKEGYYIWILSRAMAIWHTNGSAVRLVGTHVNLTEQKQLEHSLRQAKKLAEETSQAKTNFLANMSHELRTPLNSILTISEMLQAEEHGTLNEMQLRLVGHIMEGGTHLLSLINDILDMAKIEAGHVTLEYSKTHLTDICAASLRMIKQIAFKKSIKVQPLAVPDIDLQLDPKRLKQILVNLLTNAVKFTPEGGTISLTGELEQDNTCLKLVVTDTGIGIAEEHLVTLFEPFVQVQTDLTRQYEGTGLGLALVQRLVEMHGGSIKVNSTPNEGSQFIILLPYYSLNKTEEHNQGEQTIVDIQPAITSRPLTILVAEDNLMNLEIISIYLKRHNHHIVKAYNGLEAIECLYQNTFDLILMDIQMPVMDGLSAISKIRQEPAYHALPIIALTALAMPGDKERCLEIGANAYLSKPIKLKELEILITELCKKP